MICRVVRSIPEIHNIAPQEAISVMSVVWSIFTLLICLKSEQLQD